MTGRTSGRLVAATVLGGALLAGGASEASAQSGNVQFITTGGDVRCDVIMIDGGPHVTCVSEGARSTMPECTSPHEKIPAVQVLGSGPGDVLCWNQGLVGTPRVLHPGTLGNAHGVTVIADPLGGLHVLSPALVYVAYAGPNTVGTSPLAVSSASSR